MEAQNHGTPPKISEVSYEILDPATRWFPADETLREQGYEKLLPPLVAELRKKVRDWRVSDYSGASETSRALLKWWFLNDHPTEGKDGEDIPFSVLLCTA